VEPRWVSRKALLHIHAELIREHGGSHGVRDEHLVESALGRPRNRWEYGDPPPDLHELAAAYAFGLAKNHAFVDGNKRIALAAAAVLLRMNGIRLVGEDAHAYAATYDLATGELSEKDFGRWLRASTESVE
jgi:death on curing protein